MNKGSRYPKARARWLLTDYDLKSRNAPVWQRLLVALIIVLDVDDFPVPFNLTQDDCTYAQWSYRPSDGAIVWHGTWDLVYGSGDFWVYEIPTGTEYFEVFVVFRYNVLGVDTDIVLANTPSTFHGDWGLDFGDRVDMIALVDWSPPWVPLYNCQVTPCTYGQIREAGIDADDTSPVTWTLP